MAGLNVTARNAMLDGNDAVWPPDQISLHTADPGAGTSPTAGELSGGAPAYTREALSWSAANAGVKSNSAPVVFDVPGGSSVSHIGYWRGATYLGARATSPESFTGQGTYTIAAGDIDETQS